MFRHEAYEAFAQKVSTCRDGEAPSQLSILYQAMPLLAERLDTIDSRHERT